MTDHISWDTLNAVADGVASSTDRERAEVHLAACVDCADTLQSLRSTVASAADLPRDVVPPAELWSHVRSTIDARKVAALGASGAKHNGARRGWFVTPHRVAAAAVVLVALSSLTTFSIMRSPNELAAPVPSAVVTASWQNAERGYLTNVEALRRQLDGQRTRLAPATLAAVEASLATIDAAIAEARAALLNDPANAALPELLASNYRQKVELLRRATQLDAS